MFWDYELDSTGALLDAVDAGLGVTPNARRNKMRREPRAPTSFR